MASNPRKEPDPVKMPDDNDDESPDPDDSGGSGGDGSGLSSYDKVMRDYENAIHTLNAMIASRSTQA